MKKRRRNKSSSSSRRRRRRRGGRERRTALPPSSSSSPPPLLPHPPSLTSLPCLHYFSPNLTISSLSFYDKNVYLLRIGGVGDVDAIDDIS